MPTNLLMDNTITKDVYDRKIEYLHRRRLETDALLSEYKSCGEEYEKALNALISIAHSSFALFKSSKMVIQRELLLLVFSNLQLSSCKLQWILREPFSSMMGLGENLLWRQIIDTVRTNHHKEVIDLYRHLSSDLVNELKSLNNDNI